MQNTTILLLGSTGFAGSNISKSLEANSIDFVSSSLKGGVDLRNFEQTANLIADCKPKIIINCAAHVGSLNYVTEKAATIVMDNSRMILNMYEAVALHSKSTVIINPIANCAYPASATLFKEAEWWNGHLHRSVLSYGSTRRFMWSVSECFAMQYGIKTISLLTPNMYGSFDSTDPNKAHALNALISKFVKAEKEGSNEIEVWGTGAPVREWLYAGDFAQIILSILESPSLKEQLKEPVNIAQNSGLSVKELVEIINSNYGNKFKVLWKTDMPDGAPRKVMDDSLFRAFFPDFKFTVFEEGIKETIKFYQSVYPY